MMRGVLLLAAVTGVATGCSHDVQQADGTGGSGSASTATNGTGGTGAGSTGAGDPGGELETLHPDAPPLPGQTECVVEVRSRIPIASAKHLELCTQIDYPTNPPSGGDHWPRWAAFTEYDDPVPHEMLVHDLEHGAIVMLHDCDGCDGDVVGAFDDAQDAHGIDQLCVQSGSIARFVVAPDPELDFPLAMAAWGATYNATCIDPPSIAAFVEEHYAGGTENICAAGVDPSTIPCP